MNGKIVYIMARDIHDARNVAWRFGLSLDKWKYVGEPRDLVGIDSPIIFRVSGFHLNRAYDNISKVLISSRPWIWDEVT